MSQPTEVGRPPLFGRQAELETIAAALVRPSSRGVAILGPAGVGKSRLATECCQLAEASGMAVVSAAASGSSARLVLGALAHLLPPASDLADLHQDLQPTRLLQSARIALTERAGGKPLVLSIDDAHHLDAVSAQLINQLVATDIGFVVLTIRSGETVPPAIASLWRDGFLDRIDLNELRHDDIAAMAASMLGICLDATALAWLVKTSGGNALFVRELLLSGRETGALVLDGQCWRLADRHVAHPNRSVVAPGSPRRSNELALSPRLAELVEERLGGVSAEQRRALDLLALAEPLGLEIAEELLGIDSLDVLDRRGLVRVVADGRRLSVALTHPLYVEALRRSPMSIRKRADLGLVAHRVTATGARRREDAVRIAGWQLARGGQADPEVLYRAALAAQLNFDDHSAIELATAGLNQNPSRHWAAEFALCRGLAFNRHGRFVDACVDLEYARSLAASDDQITRSALWLSSALLERDGSIAAAVAILDAALDDLTDEAQLLDIYLERATLLADSGAPTAAAKDLALIAGRSLSVEQSVLRALAEASIHLSAGRPESAVAVANAGLHDHLSNLQAATTYHPTSHFLPRILGLLDAGNFERAEHDARWIRKRAEDERRPIGLIGGQLFVALAFLHRGRARSATVAAKVAIETAPAQLPAYMLPMAWAVLAQAHALMGELGPAAEALAEFDRRANVVDGFAAIEALLAGARVAQATGRSDEAARLLRGGIEVSLARGNLRVAFAALDELVHFHRDRLAAAQLLALAGDGEGSLLAARVLQAHALLTADDVCESLAEAAAAFLALGMHLRAAEAGAQAVDRARLASDTRSMARFSHFVAAARAECEVPTSTSMVGVNAVVALTDRERQIATLVGQGGSSKEVAALLFVSIRTVDNHLQRIYAKVGVTNRKELAVAIGLHGFE